MGSSICVSPSQVLDSVSSFGYILSSRSLSFRVFLGVCVFPGEVGVGDVD